MNSSAASSIESLPWKQIVGKAVHDMRTPLSSMRVTLEVLRLSSAQPDKLPMLIGMLEGQTEELARLLKTLSDNPREFAPAEAAPAP